ncbi:MAG: thioredoxin [Bacteroidales bacterium]|nr:thioredoxin [Bacteroidales bacterium]
MAVLQLNNENFDQNINASKIAVVDFWTPWCGPCRSMLPIIEKIADKFDGKVLVAKVDADDATDIASKFNIRNVPYFLFFKDGQVVDRHVGKISENDLIDKINSFL